MPVPWPTLRKWRPGCTFQPTLSHGSGKMWVVASVLSRAQAQALPELAFLPMLSPEVTAVSTVPSTSQWVLCCMLLPKAETALY